MTRKTKSARRRTNQHGLSADYILGTLRSMYPKAHKIARRGDDVCVWRDPKRGETPLNSEYIIDTVGPFDSFRLTATGKLTTR